MTRYLIAACLALAGCTTPIALPGPANPSGAVAVADRVTLTGARAFAAAELGYITAARGVGIAVDNGLIRGATATTVRGYNARARQLLVDGKATTDVARKASIAAELFGITDRLDALLGSN